MAMEKYKFTVYGNPRGKGRPRFYQGHACTDKATAAYERLVKTILKNRGFKRLEKIPTTVIINAFFPVPASLSKKKREELFGSPHLKKPDSDNIAKIILDACNELWADDSQVDTVYVCKRYVFSDEEKPRVEVEVLGGMK